MKARTFISSYVKAADVKAPQTVTITTAESKEFENDGRKKTSLVLYFREITQGVVLCGESIEQLCEIFGSDDTDLWVGKTAVLFNDPGVKFGGKKVGGLRFRAK